MGLGLDVIWVNPWTFWWTFLARWKRKGLGHDVVVQFKVFSLQFIDLFIIVLFCLSICHSSAQ